MGTIIDQLGAEPPERPNNVHVIDWVFDDDARTAIVDAHERGLSNAQIARILSEQHPVDTQDVYRWLRSRTS